MLLVLCAGLALNIYNGVWALQNHRRASIQFASAAFILPIAIMYAIMVAMIA